MAKLGNPDQYFFPADGMKHNYNRGRRSQCRGRRGFSTHSKYDLLSCAVAAMLDDCYTKVAPGAGFVLRIRL
jgi:hypothetical protein